QNYDPGGMDHASKEMALKITGADDQTIRRKYNPVAWQGVLPMKMFLISNKIPNFNDLILELRFIKIAFKVSFRDRADRLMREKLEAELPGIANRCLSGYRRLCARKVYPTGKWPRTRQGSRSCEQSCSSISRR